MQKETAIKRTDDGFAISKYTDDKASLEFLGVQVNRLWAAFPRMEQNFFNLLMERMAVAEFTEQRAEDAANHVIDTFRYKELSIADIISYDQRIKLYTYHEMCAMVDKGYKGSDFESREISGKRFWVKLSEVQNM